MNLILQRNEYAEDGIFGTLLDEIGNQVAVTLERSYASGNGDGSYAPKIPAGSYMCQRGMHQLEHMTRPFETFQVMHVPGHTNILFHAGNYNADSDGCILLGRRVVNDYEPHSNSTDSGSMITSSQNTFNKFLDMQKGLDSFTLLVKDKE